MEQYEVHFGEAGTSQKLHKNTRGLTFLNYFLLLKNVCLSEITTFYSFYLLMLSFLLIIPEVSTYSPFWILIPLIIIVLLEYFVQAIELKRAQNAISTDENQKFYITREGNGMNEMSKNIKAGDMIEFDLEEGDEMVAPCDCLILKSDENNIFVNTSKLDGEWDAKSKSPLQGLPENLTYEIIKRTKGYTLSNSIKDTSTDITGEINFYADDIFQGTYEPIRFDKDNFIERGSVIQTQGKYLLLAIYTGKDCRSDSKVAFTDVKKTLVDQYIEKISIMLFIIQFITACVIGICGYYAVERPNYIPSESLDNAKDFKVLILIARNYCLISGVIPITLKFILPLFRFIYGIFITYDLNFYDSETGNRAFALSTKTTENLGAVDLIVSDKTGTLTKGKLKLITMAIGNVKYGDNANSSSIIEDVKLDDDLKSNTDPMFLRMFQALSICHSLNIDEHQNIYGSSSDEIAIVEALKELGWKFYFPRSSQNREYNIKSPQGDYSYEIIKVNKFDRDRMRMSVIARINNEIFCFMKGASEKIIEKCTQSNEPRYDYKTFQKNGYRTLSVSYRKLNSNESLDIENTEINHTLLGTVAFEDELQNDAHITLDILTQAGIKFWVATGDAKLNTLITSTRLNLINSENPIVHLKKENLEEEKEQNNGANLFSFRALSKEVEENSYSVVVDSENEKTIKEALESKQLLRALYKARSVIFYRTKPSTKADISIAIQNFGKNVLSIGDGYNDSALLNSANVGVGIISSNGARPFTGCDFAIPKFKNLLRLVIIHGHQSLHRSVLAVNASFYKGILIAGVQSIYQLWTDGTGQSFFDQFAAISFDYLWTSIPILSIIFEKDISESFLFQIPSLYRKLMNPLTLGKNVSWIFFSIYQSIMTIVILYVLTGESFINDDGIEFGKTYMSILAFFVLLFTYIFYLIYQTNTFTYYSIVLLTGDVLILVAVIAILQSRPIRLISSEQWVGFFGECFCNYKMLIIMITIFLINVTPPWLWYAVYPEFKLSETIRIIELETISSKKDEPLFFDPPKKK